MKERGSGRLVLSDSESVAAFSDKFIVKPKFVVEHLKHLDGVDFKKKKRGEERREQRKARRQRRKIMRIMLGKICAKIQQN